jgi:hypothetical protein
MGFSIPPRGKNSRRRRQPATYSTEMKRALIASLVLTVAAATATALTAASYAGVCSQLTGFPGLLQRAGFVPAGPCATKSGGSVCQSGAACTTSNRRPGKCKNIAVSGPANCACVEITVSPGLR